MLDITYVDESCIRIELDPDLVPALVAALDGSPVIAQDDTLFKLFQAFTAGLELAVCVSQRLQVGETWVRPCGREKTVLGTHAAERSTEDHEPTR